jgi:hypothetical protein
MEIARSDARVFDGEGRRLVRLLELHLQQGEFPVELFDRTIDVADASSVARPGRAAPLVIAGRAHCLRAEHLLRVGGDSSQELGHVIRLAREAVEIAPDDPDHQDLLALLNCLGSESVGVSGG